MNGDNKPKIIVYPGIFGNIPEVWIYRHVSSVKNYVAHVLTVKYLNKSVFEHPYVHYIDHASVVIHRLYQIECLFRTFRNPRSEVLKSWRFKKLMNEICPVLIHCHFLWNAREILLLNHCTKTPIVVSAHGSDVNLARVNEKYRSSIVSVFLVAQKVIAPSDFIADQLTKIGCPKSKIARIYLGAPIPAEKSTNLKNKDKVEIVSTGSLKKVKGHKYLIDAFSQASKKDCRLFLTIVGDGEERENLRNQIINLGLNNKVKITGYLPPRSVQAVLKEADIYAQHSIPEISETHGLGQSLKEEALGISFVEASALGLPIIATRMGGVPEICRHTENGFLVEPFDTDSMAQRISELANNPKLRNKLGKNGRLLVEREFNSDKQIAKIEDLYDQILSC